MDNYFFKHDDWGDDWQEICADDFEHAAKRFAEIYNDGDYALMDDEQTVIISNGKIEKTFVISAEPSIKYFAREISQTEDE